MAEKKTRKFATWRIKWILLYIAVILFFMACLACTIIYLENGALKSIAALYEIFVILFAICIPIAAIVIHKKESKDERQGLSKQEYNKYLQQAKNCDIHAK